MARANQRRQILTQKPALAKAGVMNELKTRGANDVLIAVVDGLKGDRHGLRADGGADLHHSFDPQFAGLRVVERSQDLHARSEGDLPGGDRSNRTGPARYIRGEMGEAIPGHRPSLATGMGACGAAIRLSAGDPQDDLHDERRGEPQSQFAQDHQNARQLPDEAALKLLFLAIRNAGLHWRPPIEWTAAMGQFAILFGDRFEPSVH